MKFIIKRQLGIGTFSHVYQATDQHNNSYALKFEKTKTNKPQLINEAKLLKQMKDNKITCGIPQVYRCSTEDQYVVMVMQLLGPSLQDLFYYYKKQFNLKTIIRFGLSALNIIQSIHKQGIIHRDIKPQNFLIGKNKSNQLYLIDFGMSKKYKEKNNSHIIEKQNSYFVGNPRFASLNGHKKKELSRRDDLQSLAYVLIYFFKGFLPWQGIPSQNKNDKWFKTAQMKESLIHNMDKEFPKHLCSLLLDISELGFEQQPNYNQLRHYLQSITNERDVYFQWCIQ